MSFYKYFREAWKKPKEIENYKTYVRKWRTQDSVNRVEKPTKIIRAHSLGYKSKQGMVIVRSRIPKGGRNRPRTTKARKQTKYGQTRYTTHQSLQSLAEKRAIRKFPNLEVLNSYYAGEDGQYKYYEIIMYDKYHPVIKSDKNMKPLLNQRRRVFRGLTSAGKKSREK
ncbi:MAG: 50S ribosomal protein L15e [Candidatus Aenigmarchaeota archaeon]|nr:50S ribosomal protein L15e [Candidatus Aenigmarchaeota archaeon]